MTYERNLTLYDKLIQLFPEIERKGKTMPYTSINGHMFSFLDKEGNMGLRMNASDRDSFLADYSSRLMEQHGRTMKEYVVVPVALLARTKKLATYFEKSYAYVGSLKPKPTKK